MAETRILPGAPVTRISLRAPATSRPEMSRRLELELPDQPGRSAVAGARAALWLGPDEWLVLDETRANLVGLCADARVLHAAVDISDRDVGLFVDGPLAHIALAAGCPLDLPAFDNGRCARTLLGKTGIVLWRLSQHRFRIEVARSHAPYVQALLERSLRLMPR